MVELPDWLSPFFIFQKSSQNAWHLIHCLKSWHLIRGYNLTHILQWICFHIRKPSFFRSLASNPNLRKSPEIRRFLALDFISLTSILPSPHGSRQYRECPQYMGTNHMPVYGGTNQVYAVTAGATVPAAFAGVHRNHHFDTMKRLHPLMHPLHPDLG